ncbi:Sec-independent protein translocase subunit TatA [Georgenia alba]|uniref:Sec-independent protein translocase protein TatA n=1 Tax=Georgenia alba TaxID=2233858 RepID=A0ABW2QCN1_9MICO
MRGMFQPSHIIILVLVIVLIFGATKLPDIARSVGQSLKVFKKEVKELRDDDSGDSEATGGATSSYTATGGQSPQANPPYPSQQPPPGGQQGTPGAAEQPSAGTPPKS